MIFWGEMGEMNKISLVAYIKHTFFKNITPMLF